MVQVRLSQARRLGGEQTPSTEGTRVRKLPQVIGLADLAAIQHQAPSELVCASCLKSDKVRLADLAAIKHQAPSELLFRRVPR